MSASGSELRNNNEKIVRLMSVLKQQRDEMHFLIQKQQDEKTRIETEIERLTFKLTLLTKSLTQRVQAKNNYDLTIKEIEDSYMSLVEDSGKLLFSINKEVHHLEEIMDKKTGTGGSVPEENGGSEGKAWRPASLSNEELTHTLTKQLAEKERRRSSHKSISHEGSTPNSSKIDTLVDALVADVTGSPTEENAPSKHEVLSELDLADVNVSYGSKEEYDQQVAQSPIEEDDEGEEMVDTPDEDFEEENNRKSSRRSSQRTETSSRRSERSSVVSKTVSLGVNSLESGRINKLDYAHPPKIRRGDDSDAELQSYREAYERAHMAASPQGSIRRGSKR